MCGMVLVVCSFLALQFNIVLGNWSGDDFRIWGPGLKPHKIIMPARYFFIQAFNENAECKNINLDVTVEGEAEDGRRCRIWLNNFSTGDCSYIVRYKAYETCKDLTISIKNDNKHVAESPYEIKYKTYSDDCNCATKSINKWLTDWECGKVSDQIDRDLEIFENVDLSTSRDQIIKKYNNPGAISLCHYVTKNNEIYRKCYGKYVGFKMFMDNILLSLSRKFKLPDLEFFVNLGDWPLAKKPNDKYPIFSWCGSSDTYDIVMPTYDITESTLENMGRVMLDMISVQGNVKYSWEQRTPKVFWRGRDSNRERLHLIDISRKYPDLFNVSLTNFFFFRSEEDEYGPKAEHVSFFSFADYKYQLSIDGTVAAYRLPYLLGGGSLLLKQESKYYEHFYNALKPNVHYIAVKTDLSDLIEKINWALENDAEAKEIAVTGQQYAKENLLPMNIFCYHALLLNEYKKKLISKVEVLEDMELVENPIKNCNCDKNYKEEL